jgi:hypothetical protein
MPKPRAPIGVNTGILKKPLAVVIAGGAFILLASAIVMNSCLHQSPPTPRVSGPLSSNDVVEIIQLVQRERAPVTGEFAPKDGLAWERRLRERFSGRIRSITSINGQKANVDFGDRWNPKIGYDYDLERTTNGWKVIGVGRRWPARKTSQ